VIEKTRIFAQRHLQAQVILGAVIRVMGNAGGNVRGNARGNGMGNVMGNVRGNANF
jgi:hypothetical protein